MRLLSRFKASAPVALLVLTALLGPAGAMAGSQDTPEGTTWVLIEYSDAGQLVAAPEGVESTLFLTAGQASGSTGCNSFGGSYTLDGRSLAFGLLAMTEMACEEPRMTLEAAVAERLPHTGGWSIEEDGTLWLLDQSGERILHYRADQTPTLDGTSWILHDYLGADGPTVVVPGSNATLSFAGGQASGSTGCNSFNGSYTEGPDSSLSIGLLGTTKMACDEELNAQEAAVLTALGEAASYVADGGSLRIRDAAGTDRLTYAPLAELEGTTWIPLFSGDQEPPERLMTLSFQNGQVSGSGPCNDFTGTYSTDGSSLTISSIVSTMMACPDLELETAYFAALEATASHTVDVGPAASDLILFDAGGGELWRFTTPFRGE